MSKEINKGFSKHLCFQADLELPEVSLLNEYRLAQRCLVIHNE